MADQSVAFLNSLRKGGDPEADLLREAVRQRVHELMDEAEVDVLAYLAFPSDSAAEQGAQAADRCGRHLTEPRRLPAS